MYIFIAGLILLMAGCSLMTYGMFCIMTNRANSWIEYLIGIFGACLFAISLFPLKDFSKPESPNYVGEFPFSLLCVAAIAIGSWLSFRVARKKPRRS